MKKIGPTKPTPHTTQDKWGKTPKGSFVISWRWCIPGKQCVPRKSNQKVHETDLACDCVPKHKSHTRGVTYQNSSNYNGVTR